MASVKVDTIGEITLLRSTGKILGNVCHACKLPKNIPDADYGLIVDMDSISLTICKFHEGMLLERLLTNYLKRIRRPKTIGFTGPLSKPAEEKKEEKSV